MWPPLRTLRPMLSLSGIDFGSYTVRLSVQSRVNKVDSVAVEDIVDGAVQWERVLQGLHSVTESSFQRSSSAPSSNFSFEQSMSSSRFEIREHVIPAQHIREYPGATATSQEEVLNLHIKQYTPIRSAKAASNAVTFIGAHANGFPKELYEPLWDEILDRSRGHFEIRGIWIADVAHQGESYVLNESILSNDPSWFDHSRDLLHMVNHFRAYMPRPIVGIGHSFGGTQIVNLSLIHPRLFTALVLLDPVIELGPTTSSSSVKDGASKFSIATASTHRRDLWPSVEEARATFNKSAFYQRWDKRVLNAWLRYGLRELPTAVYPQEPSGSTAGASVTLKTPKHQEVWTYLRPNYGGRDESGQEIFDRKATPDLSPGAAYDYPFYRPESSITFHRLPFVRPPVFFILGEQSTLSSPECQRDKVKLTGTGVGGSGGIATGRVADITLAGIGHLVPFEATDATAQETVSWLSTALRSWNKEEDQWRKSRAARPSSDHLRVNEDWVKHIGVVPGRKARGQDTKL